MDAVMSKGADEFCSQPNAIQPCNVWAANFVLLPTQNVYRLRESLQKNRALSLSLGMVNPLKLYDMIRASMIAHERFPLGQAVCHLTSIYWLFTTYTVPFFIMVGPSSPSCSALGF